MAKVLVGLYVASVLALVAAAVGIWRLHCESFGCIGVGVAWVAWVVAFFVVSGVGLFARSKAAPATGLARVCQVTGWLQLGAGVVLVVVWFAKNAA